VIERVRSRRVNSKRRAGVQVSPHPGECASAAPGGPVDADPYARSGRRWALGAELVYGPIAAELVATCAHPLAGRTVLDAGAGTGAVSAALASQHARAVAIDLSAGMLAWNAAARPPCAMADIRTLPFAAASVDDVVAAFVLNHLTDPTAGLAELARVTRPGGIVLAAVFSSASHSEARDRIDAAALAAGWQVPAWYGKLKASATPLLGGPAAMAATARAAGLTHINAEERPVDVGVTQPHQLVRYRLGHPIFADWLDTLGPSRTRAFATEAEHAIRKLMRPYRPVVVFLRARTKSK
jgi:SAM-dependent methyltransferase